MWPVLWRPGYGGRFDCVLVIQLVEQPCRLADVDLGVPSFHVDIDRFVSMRSIFLANSLSSFVPQTCLGLRLRCRRLLDRLLVGKSCWEVSK